MKYHILRSSQSDMLAAERDIFSQLALAERASIRVVVFTSIAGEAEYRAQRERISQGLRDLYGERAPMFALVVQPPLGATLYAEVTTVEQQREIRYCGDYIIVDNRLIMSGGIYASCGESIGEQSEAIFQRVGEILSAEQLSPSDIVRQWNFIEHITSSTAGGQNYQQFNDARSHFYGSSDWSNGYPAATGIGAEGGGVVVLFVAVRNSAEVSRPIDNPLQISAHAYSQQVLIEGLQKQKSTPKFERARWLQNDDAGMIYISGTAAIRGEESLQADATAQIAMTMENIAHLVSVGNQALHAVPNARSRQYEVLRVYVKREELAGEIAEWLGENCSCRNVAFLKADICRSELLVEVEGIAK